MEIQHLIILSFDFSLQIILISLPQSVLSGERIANRSAAKKRTFLSHHHCKSPRLSQSNPPTSRNMSAGVADLLPRKFPFLPKHCATKFSEFPEPQNSKCHGQCQGYDLKDERREGLCQCYGSPLNNNNNNIIITITIIKNSVLCNYGKSFCWDNPAPFASSQPCIPTPVKIPFPGA